MEYQQIMWFITLAFAAAGLFPLVYNLRQCYKAILNDARIISRDPALQSNFEILYAYPGFWALFWYRLSHALLHQKIPVISEIVPRLAMSAVRYATSIDIHPAAQISGEGILIDHGTGLVVGATAVIGGEVTLYHGVTLGNSGRKVPAGAKRHPTIGDRVVIGAGAKILGDIVIGDDVLVGANSVVTKPVPRNHTAVGVPARVLCHGAATSKDVAGAAICELHKRLQKVEKEAEETTRRPGVPTATATATATATDTNTATATISTQTTTGTTAVTPAIATAPASTAPASIAAAAAAAAPASAAIATVAGLPSATAVPTAVSGPVSPSVVWTAAAAASPPRGQGSAVPASRGAFFAEELLRSGSVPPGFALAKASARGVAAAPAPAAAAVAAAAAATAATAAESTEVKPSSRNLKSFSSTTKTNVKPFSTTVSNVKPFSKTTTTTTNVKPFSTTATTTANVKPFSTTTTNVKPFSTTTTTATPDVKPSLTANPSLVAVKPFPTTNAKPSLPVFLASGGGRGVLREKGEGGEGRFGADGDGRSNSIRDIMYSLRVLGEE